MKEIAIMKESELTLIQSNVHNKEQMQFLLQPTPNEYVKKRPAKGGGEWSYVSVGYVKKCLNMIYGFDWSFEITNQMVQFGEAIVQGRLTVNSNGKKIVKEQFGNKEIMFKNDYIPNAKGGKDKVKTDQPLSIGNDLKAAASDCLKKCAADLGIAADVYNADEFQQVIIDSTDWAEIRLLVETKKHLMTEELYKHAIRIVDAEELKQLPKMMEYLNGLEEPIKEEEAKNEG